MKELAPIPVIDARGLTPAHVVRQRPQEIGNLMLSARRRYTRAGLALGDAVSRRWLRRNGNPYLAEIEATGAAVGQPGATLLNVSYEWACTSGTRPAPGGGQMLVRVLDWDLDGLGRNICAIRQSGPAGDWVNIGWPGFSGAITATAHGRFAAAINQPPLRASRAGAALATVSARAAMGADWLASRSVAWTSSGLPPAHLLRRVMDEAADFDRAVALLRDTPVSTPALFTVAGVRTGQGCVIERTRDAAAIRWADPTVAVANHWAGAGLPGIARGHDSQARQMQLEIALEACAVAFDPASLAGPVLNSTTRLVAVADPAAGSLWAQGWESDGPATAPLHWPGK